MTVLFCKFASVHSQKKFVNVFKIFYMMRLVVKSGETKVLWIGKEKIGPSVG